MNNLTHLTENVFSERSKHVDPDFRAPLEQRAHMLEAGTADALNAMRRELPSVANIVTALVGQPAPAEAPVGARQTPAPTGYPAQPTVVAAPAAEVPAEKPYDNDAHLKLARSLVGGSVTAAAALHDNDNDLTRRQYLDAHPRVARVDNVDNAPAHKFSAEADDDYNLRSLGYEHIESDPQSLGILQDATQQSF